MHVDTALGPAGRTGDLADAHRGRVARQDALGRRKAIELSEHMALHVEVLEHRFDDEVCVAHRFVHVSRRSHPRQRLLGLGPRQLSLLDAAQEVTSVGLD